MVWGVALHVLEVKVFLSALSHLSQVRQETQQLVEFILKKKAVIENPKAIIKLEHDSPERSGNN